MRQHWLRQWTGAEHAPSHCLDQSGQSVTYQQRKKLRQFAMPKTCEDLPSLVNSCVYYACQTCEIYQILPYSVDFKAPGELWNPLSKTVFSKCSFTWNKGPVNIWKDPKTKDPKDNLYVTLANIFPNFLHCISLSSMGTELDDWFFLFNSLVKLTSKNPSLHYWLFVSGIHWWALDFPHKRKGFPCLMIIVSPDQIQWLFGVPTSRSGPGFVQ